MNNLKCLPCTDAAIEPHAAPARPGEQPNPYFWQKVIETLPDAVSMAPLVQMLNTGGQTIAAVVAVPVCVQCRAGQLKPSSRLAVM